jgi:hypothetical protein
MASKRAYSTLPFFRFLEDESVPARRRLGFMPCMAPFIMDFGDLNKYVLRDESSDDPHQHLVNLHTYEDDHHWPWYLEDLDRLGYDTPQPPAELLGSLYSDRHKVNRMLASRLAHLIFGATPVERMVIIEAIEETGNVLFERTAAIARQLERDEGIELRYLGDFHLALESGHARDGDDHRTLAAIELSDDERLRCDWLNASVFALFTDWVAELHDYALTEAGTYASC